MKEKIRNVVEPIVLIFLGIFLASQLLVRSLTGFRELLWVGVAYSFVCMLIAVFIMTQVISLSIKLDEEYYN